MVSAKTLLGKLPPFTDTWVTVKENQKVKDIIKQILVAHKKYADYYDQIALYFDAPTIEGICDKLYKFLKAEIKYSEEPEHDQTTALPTGILTRGYGDCKHYASFCGGVLDALQRLTGRKIEWCYRFASYKILSASPHHVFVVVYDGDDEIWIDPVPGANNLEPVWLLDKKISSMPLRDNIGYVHNDFNDYYGDYSEAYNENSIGWTMETSAGYTTSGPTIVPQTRQLYPGHPFLGLSRYGNLTNTDLNKLTQQLQALINEGPRPWTLPASMVNKVSTSNMQHFNFLYPTGTNPVPRPWQSDPDLTNWLMMTITPDGRLTFDRNEEPPHNSPQIHKLADWANYLIQAYSDQPWWLTLEHLKRLGKGWSTPGDGSLWHVIHTGDVNFAKVSDFINDIPGLKELLATYGIDLARIMEHAEILLGGAGSVTLPDGSPQLPGGGIPPIIPGTGNNSMLFAAIAGIGVYYLTKNKMYAAAAGIGTYYLMSRRNQTTFPTSNYPAS